jgi:hypothetical protein
MKTVLIMMMLSASIAMAQESQTPAQKATALNQKYAVLFDAGSDAREAKAEAAMKQLKDDAELIALKAQIKETIDNLPGGDSPSGSKRLLSPENAAKLAELNQKLQKRQLEKIVALHPELAPYLEAKAKHDQERAVLMREYAGNAAAVKEIAENTKRKKQ